MEYDNCQNGGMLGSFCTPLKIYLLVAVIISIVYFSYSTLKGKGFPGMSALCMNACCIILSSFLVTGLCVYNSILAWAVVILLSFCGICCTLHYMFN